MFHKNALKRPKDEKVYIEMHKDALKTKILHRDARKTPQRHLKDAPKTKKFS